MFLVRHLIYSTSLYRSFDSQPHMTWYTTLNAKISVSQELGRTPKEISRGLFKELSRI